MIAILATVLLASSADPALLAPGPEELRAAFERTEELLTRSQAIERALARLHNRWVDLAGKTVCEDAEARSIAARSRVFGAGLRDAVQAARAQQRRLDRVYAAPMVSALIDAKAKRRYERVKAAVAAAVERWAELRAWQHAELERVMKRCKGPPTGLVSTPGLSSSVACAGDECGGAVAITGIGKGLICPLGQVADGTVAVISDGQACYSESVCSCVATPVLPGAVLGP